jgi:Activator of Hsp90 ATPase homolog 1-like protein
VISTSHWSPLSGMEDKPENYHVVTYKLAEHDNQTTLTLTQSNSPTQQDADSLIENGWKTVLQALKQLVEGPKE